MNQHFASLVFGLAQQAAGALSGQLPGGLDGADAREVGRALIDTLGMLQEKTEGRLDDDERELLEQTLVALRFRYVQTEPKG